MFQPDDSFRKHIIRTKGPALGIAHKGTYCMFLVPLKLLDVFAFWFTLPWKPYLAAIIAVFICASQERKHRGCAKETVCVRKSRPCTRGGFLALLT